MEGSVAEGISTSLQTCALFSQPYDSQGIFAIENLPSPPAYDDMHVNDLGLTPSPGSQLLKSTDAITPHMRVEEHGSSEQNVEGSTATDLAGLMSKVQPEGSHWNIDKDKSYAGQESPLTRRTQTNAAGDIAVQPLSLNNSDAEHIDDLFYDPLFDSSFSFTNIDTSVDSRKRTIDEALAEEFQFWHRPEKRQMIHVSHDANATSPTETPSLSSPDTSVHLDLVETGPGTPAGIAALQLPDPNLDTFDALFDDPAFRVPPNIPELGNLPGVHPTPQSTYDDSFYDTSRRQSLSSCGPSDIDEGQAIGCADLAPEADSLETPLSDLTKERFALDARDVLANTDREVLQHVDPKPQYTSPYPLYGGALGYLPSAPGVHVKCIEVADDQMINRLSHLKAKVQHLKYERDKYKDAWSKWTTREAATGQTREQILERENATLRRVSTQHKSRVEQYKQEIEEWKAKHHELGVIYNSLLYEILVQKKIPTVAPIPPGYKPPRAPQPAQVQSIVPGTSLAMAPPAPALHQPMPGPTSSPLPTPVGRQQAARPGPPTSAHHPPAYHNPQSAATPRSTGCGTPNVPQTERVTIDLTEDETEKSTSNLNQPSATPSTASQARGEFLQSLQKKKYNWLEQAKSGTAEFEAVRAGSRADRLSEPLFRMPRQSLSTPPAPCARAKVHSAVSAEHDVQADADAELLRDLEDELARN
ncbi:uncharacterized protein ACLA_025930 [Aspergillus clavatus NRRL 1]|uniref:Uncharacterized protein n=1 Tax=Aspergillus clavatus (strain ATCC 1007 / CBS 513.65 / DSM 816 / NCTC 3887 / NRRL 1 / QM 1276 / 107) TaxID=344612 RepID=A1CQF5_ASPCL|nr:uncharacterized protein ACLA_025930 [Aspergillus clavatus NRRL 1]EAW07876.1 conserved hypothetical protein [Aspergillus clavatus NRRL 1]